MAMAIAVIAVVAVGAFLVSRQRIPRRPDAYIFTDTRGLHHVLVDDRQCGVYTSCRKAERELRYQVRERKNAGEDW